MKIKEAVEAKILPKGDEPIVEWFQSMQFKSEMIMAVEEGLKETEAKAKEQDRDYELMRSLHMNSQSSGQGKAIIGVTVMQANFTNYIDELTTMTSSHQDKVSGLQKLGGCVHITTEELQDRLNVFKYLARVHSKWLLRYTNVHVQRHEELILIIVSAKAYKENEEKEKKVK